MRGMRSTMTLLAAAAVLLAGCGGDDETAPPAGTPAPSAAPRDGSAGSFPSARSSSTTSPTPARAGRAPPTARAR